jgi:hypothetical protein
MSSCRAVYERINRRCGLASSVGVSERCPGSRCPFWEADVRHETSGRCSIEEVIPYLKTLPELAQYLLDLRTRLRRVDDPRSTQT